MRGGEHEHVFEPAELHLVTDGVDTASTCRCGAVAYDADRPGQEAARARLVD